MRLRKVFKNIIYFLIYIRNIIYLYINYTQKINMDDERFSKIAGNTYEKKINDLYIIIKEKERENEDRTEDINNLVETMAEYVEWKKWAKKEVKRRTALIWGNNHNKKYKPLREVIY